MHPEAGESGSQQGSQEGGAGEGTPEAGAAPSEPSNLRNTRQLAPDESGELFIDKEPRSETDIPQLPGVQRNEGAIAWGATPTPAEAASSPRDTTALDLLLTGLVGAQSWYSRVLDRNGKRHPAATKGQLGQWITAPGDGQEPEVAPLDHRAGLRQKSDRKLGSGAIETTAQKWMDSAFGMHSSVQSSHYGDKIAGRAVIDWGSEVEPQPVAAKEPVDTIGSQKPN
jgi:hypothetical protein